MNEIIKHLFELQDLKYRDFHSRLMPTVDKARIIGVRTPALRSYSKEIAGTDIAERFLKTLPHKYYEENNLHAFLVEKIKDYDECIAALDKFLPYVDNWATCDMMSPRVLKKHPERLIIKIDEWLKSEHLYTVRFAIVALMKYYLDGNFDASYLGKVAAVQSEEYYIKMAVAWYFATALSKQYDTAIKFIENKTLDPWTHNKAIQKARESYRISAEQKEYLAALRI